MGEISVFFFFCFKGQLDRTIMNYSVFPSSSIEINCFVLHWYAKSFSLDQNYLLLLALIYTNDVNPIVTSVMIIIIKSRLLD